MIYIEEALPQSAGNPDARAIVYLKLGTTSVSEPTVRMSVNAYLRAFRALHRPLRYCSV